MQIARKKRLENISEYIIHLYKTEDLIRAYDMDIEQIEKYVISHLPLNNAEKKETRKWYDTLISAMRHEHRVQSGHLIAVQAVVDKMHLLHKELLAEDEAYLSIYKEAREDLSNFRKLAGGNINDIQICLNAVYGLLILRLNDRPIDTGQMKSVELFGAILSYLSYKYRQKELLRDN